MVTRSRAKVAKSEKTDIIEETDIIDKTNSQPSTECEFNFADHCNLDVSIACEELNIQLDMDEVDRYGYMFLVFDPILDRTYKFVKDDTK